MKTRKPYPVPCGGKAQGRLRVPPSKSVTHRYLNLSLLARSPSVIEHPLLADDTRLFLRALEGCGFGVHLGSDEVRLGPPTTLPRNARILCGNAGTMYRFVVASLTTLPGEWHVDGTARLRERPVGPLVEALRRLGGDIECLEGEGYAPLRIRGGSLRGGETPLEAGESSQYLSALLMAATRASQGVTVRVQSLASSPYVEITLEALARFGVEVRRRGDTFEVQPATLSPGRVRVEGDYSAAAYPAAAALLTGGQVRLEGLRPEARQGDRRFLDVLAQMGARVSWGEGEVEVAGGSHLESVDADFSDMPDQVPTLAALAPFCRGTTRIRNVPHLRIKESDRLQAMAVELTRLGAQVVEDPDGLTIRGSWADGEPPREEVVVKTYDDHRIAMSLALVGLRRPGVVIGDPGVVAKSYPDFWRDLERLVQ